MVETASKHTTAGRLAIYFALFFAVFAATGSGHFYVVDELTRYNVTKSIYERGTLAIENGYGEVGRDGRLYGKYGLMQSFAALPLYAAGSVAARGADGVKKDAVTVFFVSFLNQALTALTCVLMVVFCERRLGLGVRAALGSAVIYAFFTMAWQYSRTFFVEPLICAVLMWQVIVATGVKFRDEGRGAFALGGLMAVSVLARAETVVYAPVFFVLCAMCPRERRVKAAALFCAPVAAAVGVVLWYNYFRYGGALNFGYAEETFSTAMHRGLYLLLFSPGKGVFFYSPVVVMFFFSLRALFARDRRLAWLVVLLTVLPLAVYSRWNLPGGDLSWGPRYLLTSVMLMSACVWPGVSAFAGGRMRGVRAAALAGLFAVSFFVQILSLCLDFHTYTNLVFDAKNAESPGRKTAVGMDYVNYVPLYSPISGHYGALRFMLDHDYRPRQFDFGADTEKTLAEALRPDFTVERLLRRGAGSP